MNHTSDFAAMILTYGRADKVTTLKTLRNSGYSGRIILVCDDLDPQLERYKENYGPDVRVFSKAAYQGTFDSVDNFGVQASPIYARNAVWDIVKSEGIKYFAVADDDYSGLEYRITPSGDYRPKRVFNADDLFAAYVAFLRRSGADVICFAQGGDYIGGKDGFNVKNGFRVLRKMMNWYFFDADKPVYFTGVLNDDLNSSLTNAIEGKKIFTSTMNSINQAETQSSKGGITELYLAQGTYVKSFYSVILAPSCVKISTMGDTALRIHHRVSWNNAVPKIIRQIHKKA